MHVVSNFKTPATHLHPLDLDIHFCAHADPITSVKFSQDGHCQLVSSLDNNIRLLDKDSGELLNTLVLTQLLLRMLFTTSLSVGLSGTKVTRGQSTI